MWKNTIPYIFILPPTSNGETKFSDTVFALTAEARTAMNDAVVSAYEEQFNMQEDELEEESEDESEVFEQTM